MLSVVGRCHVAQGTKVSEAGAAFAAVFANKSLPV
jgi:hypothetical protein